MSKGTVTIGSFTYFFVSDKSITYFTAAGSQLVCIVHAPSTILNIADRIKNHYVADYFDLNNPTDSLEGFSQDVDNLF